MHDLVAERDEPAHELLLLAVRTRDDDSHATKASSSRREHVRVVAAAALDPGSVLGRDQRREDAAVVVSRDRGEAAAADQRDAAPLRFDASPGLGVVGAPPRAPPPRRAPGARARPGPPRGACRPDRSAGRSPRSRPEPVEAARGEHDRVEPALAALAQPRVDVARGAARSTASARARAAARGAATDAVPIRMPGPIASAPQSASRGSSRGGYAPTASPSVSVEVMSLAEWTATSIRPASSASSSSLTKTPRSPISPKGSSGRGRPRS